MTKVSLKIQRHFLCTQKVRRFDLMFEGKRGLRIAIYVVHGKSLVPC